MKKAYDFGKLAVGEKFWRFGREWVKLDNTGLAITAEPVSRGPFGYSAHVIDSDAMSALDGILGFGDTIDVLPTDVDDTSVCGDMWEYDRARTSELVTMLSVNMWARYKAILDAVGVRDAWTLTPMRCIDACWRTLCKINDAGKIVYADCRQEANIYAVVTFRV